MIRSAYPKDAARITNGYLDKDLRPKETRDGEFSFFVNEAKHSGGSVLELASGAGRILMVLAEAGVNVFGLEASGPMLAIAKKAIARLPKKTQHRIHLVCGDMRRFAFKRKFPLIIIPFNSFWFNFYRASLDEYVLAEQCLKSIMMALEHGGRFIIDSPCESNHQWWATMAKKFGFTLEIVEPYTGLLSVNVLIGRKDSKG